MRRWWWWSLPVAALASPIAAGDAGYLCTVAGAIDPGYRLVRDRSGGSMGNPAQRSAYQLLDARSGQVVMRCPADVRGTRIVCTDATLGPPRARFVLDRASGRFAWSRIASDPAPETPGRREVGACRSGE
ncbi:MAG: hypothetical protein U5K33_09430 [Halofilum sp. (in: g-proteobacteria)]|nr:hypothetical protein [Halofilum sp. (in: g-proteobacteria)]